MKIKILEELFSNEGLDLTKEYEVARTETIEDDLYYIVINENGEETGVHELFAIVT